MPNIEPNGNPNTFLTNLNLRAHSRFSSQLQQQDTQITSQTTNQLNWEPSIPPYRHKPATKSPPSFEDNNSSTGQTASSRTAERTSENVTARQRGRHTPSPWSSSRTAATTPRVVPVGLHLHHDHEATT